MPLTSDPAKKLKYAEALYTDFDRPLPAEMLIEEAMKVCEKKYAEDDTCLAAVHITYAGFLQSDAVGIWAEGYRKYGFWDKTVTVDNRYGKAIEYWEKALNVFEKNKMYAEASNAYFNIGKIYHVALKDDEKACEKYDQSLHSHLVFARDYPDDEVILPKGYKSFTEFINAHKRDIGCN